MYDIEINPETGVRPGLGESVRDDIGHRALLARLEEQQADDEWLKKPFVPANLDQFRSRAQSRKETEVVTNLGSLLQGAWVWEDDIPTFPEEG